MAQDNRGGSQDAFRTRLEGPPCSRVQSSSDSTQRNALHDREPRFPATSTRRLSEEIDELIDQIRGLVLERQRLVELGASAQAIEATNAKTERLRWRLMDAFQSPELRRRHTAA